MTRKKLLMAVFALLVIAATTVDKEQYSRFAREFYLTAEQVLFIRPGLDLEVQDVSVGANGTVSVVFKVMDSKGLPLDRNGVFTPGEISVNFVLARIPAGQNHYVAYTTRNVTSPITNLMATQPTADRGGTFERIADGTYRYTLNTRLPADLDPDVTHSVGIYATRNLTEYDLGTTVDNEVVNFVPAGGDIENVRDVVRTEACNMCHDPLEAHGGARRDVELCVMCHYPGVTDPDTGNSVDFAVMVHRLHRGENLPSVEAGTPYQIIGFNQSVHDYSTVVFPQDIRNCQSCHAPEATESEAWFLNPSRRTCGSCHDDVNFATGVGHAGGRQISDMFCSFCHFPQGELEFDASIIGAHTIPSESEQLEGLNIEILEVINTGPGENPTVLFRVANDDGELIDPATLPTFSFVLAGPTTDYTMRVSEAAQSAIPMGDAFTYTFQAAIPDGDLGQTYALGAEARRSVVLNPGTTEEFTTNESAENPVVYFAVGGGDPEPRRMAVSDEKCEKCHRDLALHGTIRHNATEYCQLCHNPLGNDAPFRTEGQPRTIDFAFMIHRIHRGEDLTRDYTIVGFRGSQNNYNEVRYPGDLRNCMTCHVDETYQVPSGGRVATIALNEFFPSIPPDSKACLGCHDTLPAAAHAFNNIAPFGEACGACHGSRADFAVSRVHARPGQ